jgi:hypothetical protein
VARPAAARAPPTPPPSRARGRVCRQRAAGCPEAGARRLAPPGWPSQRHMRAPGPAATAAATRLRGAPQQTHRKPRCVSGMTAPQPPARLARRRSRCCCCCCCWCLL